ncbi:MAG: hypothetical protein QOF09_635 [Alphaproteobacteria bacterium]|jgi:hypothetical protein|nr:hypothetical protein [Alphaproteobacteria bacterium]
MAQWIEENLPALLVGAGLGIFAGTFLGSWWLLTGMAGVAVALPIWQINGHKWR